jgi:hypothetical protein
MDSSIIERAKQFEFVALWWEWLTRYQDGASNTAPPAPPFPNLGYGYRAGQFWPGGACTEDYTEEWEYFFDTMAAEHGLPGISIHALYCYEQYPSCRRFVDSGGTDYQYPR